VPKALRARRVNRMVWLQYAGVVLGTAALPLAAVHSKAYRLRRAAVGAAALLGASAAQALFAFLVAAPARCDLVYALHGLTQLHTVRLTAREIGYLRTLVHLRT
jgi:hypothetical protein